MESFSLEAFYKEKLDRVPENLRTGIGHFNVFKLEEFGGPHPRPVPYSRKDFYKISLIIGNCRAHYADKTIEIRKQGILFASSHVPYNWEQLDTQLAGYFCVFTESFFSHFGNLKNYPVFQPDGIPIFELQDEQVGVFTSIFQRMEAEIDSEYSYKYDILRNLVFELAHSAMKLQPALFSAHYASNASERVSSLFMELLERQFPIEGPGRRVGLKTASDFAARLNVHVNHLNRALKEVTAKTTTEIISERVLREARILLQHTHWNISEIAYSLGFEEVSHFSNFFRKRSGQSPAAFRKAMVA